MGMQNFLERKIEIKRKKKGGKSSSVAVPISIVGQTVRSLPVESPRWRSDQLSLVTIFSDGGTCGVGSGGKHNTEAV